MRQGNFRKREVRASVAGLAPRGVSPPGALHIPGWILGATEELGSPITLCSSIRLGPCRGDKRLSPSSLADGGTLASWLLPGMGAWQRPRGENDPPIAMPALSPLCLQVSRLMP